MFEEAEANAAELQAITAAGAFIMGRNMFGPGRGDWDLEWKGWRGDEPPYHGPVFVLTHHPRASRCRCRAARRSASSPTGSSRRWPRRARRQATVDVAIGGGAHTVNQYLAARRIDEPACMSADAPSR